MKFRYSRLITFTLLVFIAVQQGSVSDEPSPPAPSVVYAKILLPVGHPYFKIMKDSEQMDQPAGGAVENWITNKSLQIGRTKVVAVTRWVPLAEKASEPTDLWTGPGCPVSGWVERTRKGKIKVELPGWSPAAPTIKGQTLSSEIGSRGVAIIELGDPKNPHAYVGLLVAPSTAAPSTGR